MGTTESFIELTRPESPQDWSIRLVHDDEHEAAGRVTEEAYASSYGPLSEEYARSLRDVTGRLRDGDVWVAVEGTGDILGTVWVARPGRRLSELAEPGETDFRQLAVAPTARRRGVASGLVRQVIQLARLRGSHRVVLNSGPEMTEAHRLYAALGFQRLPERERDWVSEDGRTLRLLAFGLDLAPWPQPLPERIDWQVLAVAWEDPRAATLREEMTLEMGIRYGDRRATGSPKRTGRLELLPETIVATLLTLAPDGRVAGHVAIRDLEHDGVRDLEIKRLFVRPWARGVGASHALLAESERIARERGASRLILHTGDRQPDAIALYTKRGYRPIPVYSPYREALDTQHSRTFAKNLQAHPAGGL